MWADPTACSSAVTAASAAGQIYKLIYLLEPYIIKKAFHILFCQARVPQEVHSYKRSLNKKQDSGWAYL